MSEPSGAGARFGIGQLIEHNRFGYRGVIFGVDAQYAGTDEWYEAVARSRPPKDLPWYHVLVDGADHTTYVAERHLDPTDNLSQIEHPQLGEFFRAFDGERYLSRKAAH